MTTVAVDFDGVIHAYRAGWRDGTIYDELVPGAREALDALMLVHAVYIHTSREPEQVMPWLEGHGFDVTIDERCDRCTGTGGFAQEDADGRTTHVEMPCQDCQGSGLLTFWTMRGQLLVTNRKLPAMAYIDDRAVRFRNWAQTLSDLERFGEGDGRR